MRTGPWTGGFGHRPGWAPRRAVRLSAVLETFFVVLLGITFAVIGWFSFYVVYKLYQGQR